MRDMVYAPRKREVLAVRWDGSDEALDRISILSHLTGHECYCIAESKLNIMNPNEQRSDMHVQLHHWVVFGPPGGVNTMPNEEFEHNYQKV